MTAGELVAWWDTLTPEEKRVVLEKSKRIHDYFRGARRRALWDIREEYHRYFDQVSAAEGNH